MKAPYSVEGPHSVFHLPRVQELPVLKVLKLQQNRLRRFHVPIALIPTITTLDLSYNAELGGDFPEQWLNDTKNLVWICKLHQRESNLFVMPDVGQWWHPE